MTLIRKKLSKSSLILLVIIGIALLSLPILHFTGIFKLDFLGQWAMGAAEWAAMSGWNCLIISAGLFGFGFAVCYLAKDYIIGIEGNNLQVTNTNSNYTPLGTNPVPNSGTAVNP